MIDQATGRVMSRKVFLHHGNDLVAEQVTVGEDGQVGDSLVWVRDPATTDLTAQIDMTSAGSGGVGTIASHVVVTDLAGAPQELLDPGTGELVGVSRHSAFGRRAWQGTARCPWLFRGQYLDEESGWAYNRFRYYSPHLGVYGAQDPMGASANLASAQAYVTSPVTWYDEFGLYQYPLNAPHWVKNILNQGKIGEVATDIKLRDLGRRNGIGRRLNYDGLHGLRISDGSYKANLVEVKNVKNLANTQQLKDAVAYAGDRGGVLELWVRHDTNVLSTVADNPNILVNRLSADDLALGRQHLIDSDTVKFFV
ncbi:MAG: RHS repeat-associated core domain-containing protein [Corynebacterium sp.]|uniref:RHS repeat-associated core domain-containing protein n=1 Tax=Corynebacterium sp. TaxID=1720 RepID=UPI0026DEFFA9|nr:RHS repeat-associated core domain-containing protein [Corynebacterium sp.]MDO5669803.1 RHS repeat-associated core domain-containing protein [Corynebacterium sp.]